MMYNYPFFSFPTFRNYNYYPNNKFVSRTSPKEATHIPSNISNGAKLPNVNNVPRPNVKKLERQKSLNISNRDKKNNGKFHKRSIKNESNALFEVFGIKLYFDDILLISLIFFLYSEGVKDDYLFISLILLLLS